MGINIFKDVLGVPDPVRVIAGKDTLFGGSKRDDVTQLKAELQNLRDLQYQQRYSQPMPVQQQTQQQEQGTGMPFDQNTLLIAGGVLAAVVLLKD